MNNIKENFWTFPSIYKYICAVNGKFHNAKIARIINITQCHGYKLKSSLLNKGIIEEINGNNDRCKPLILTDKGKEIRDLLIKLLRIQNKN